MVHVKNHQKVNAFVKSFDEYREDLIAAFGNNDLTVNLDGTVNGDYPKEILAAYYQVSEITSIHPDGSEYNAMWIAYKE